MDLDLELGLLLLLRPLSRRKDIEGGACRLFEPKRQLSLAPFSPLQACTVVSYGAKACSERSSVLECRVPRA
jgi:hypothetical protein